MSAAETTTDREHQLVSSVCSLVDRLRSRAGPSELLGDLCASATRVLRADSAGVWLDGAGGPRIEAASSADAGRIELMLAAHLDGPGRDVIDSGDPLSIIDLTRAFDRWPRWVPEAVHVGVRSIDLFPLRRVGPLRGALHVYTSRPQRIDRHDARLIETLLDLASIGLTDR